MSKGFKNIAAVSFATLVCRVTGLLRDILMFSCLGNTWVTSAFIFGFTLPNLFRRLLGEGALSSAFIPLFSEEVNIKGKQAAFKFMDQCLSWLLIVCSGVCIITAVVLKVLPSFKTFEIRWILGFDLSVFLLPYMIFICLAAILSAVLNVLHRFTLAALSGVWLNMMMIIGLTIGACYFKNKPLHQVYILSGTVLIGGLIQLLAPCWLLHKEGWTPHVTLGKESRLKELFILVLPALGGAAIFQINILTSRLLAFGFNSQAVSELYLAQRLIELPLGIFTAAVVTVIFPKLALEVAQKDFQGVAATYERGLNIILSITIPASLGLILLSEAILKLFFEWGAFGSADVARTVPVLAINAIGLPFYSLATLATRGFHSHKNLKTPVWIALSSFFVNFIASLILGKLFGTVGLASANFISIFFQSLQLQASLSNDHIATNRSALKQALKKILISTAAMSVFIILVQKAIYSYSFFSNKCNALITVSIIIPCAIGIYIKMLDCLKLQEVQELKLILNKFLKKRRSL